MGATHVNAIQPGAPKPSDQIQTRARAVQITSREVQPTLRLYTQDEDLIQFAAITNFAGAQLNFGLRWLMPDGQIIPQIVTLNIPAAGVLTQLQVAVPEGYLLTAAMFAPVLLATGQWIYGSATLLRGNIQGANTFDQFLSGYVTHEYAPSWPDWPPQRATDGAGILASSVVGNPAAGADFTITVPTLRRWQVLGLRAILTASAAVANRFPGLVVDDGVNQFFISRTSVPTTASQSNGFNWLPGAQFFNDTQANFLLFLPTPTIALSNYRIRSSTLGIQAGDQWSNIVTEVLEWADIFG